MTIGGNGVQVTTTTIPNSAITEPADYNAKNFDPIAYLPKAIAFARKLVPDARLTSFEFGTAYPDGRVDMTNPGEADNQYTFRSVSKSAGTGDRLCMIHLELGPKTKTARLVEDDECNAKLVRHPKCSFASVWKQAMASESPPKDKAGRIGWLYDEKWFLDTKADGMSSFVDQCK
jgi:hypothetical protein